MTNKEWLATLTAEEFYNAFMQAIEKGKWDINTRLFVIDWLDEEHKENGG